MRILVELPTWLGDAVMATPALQTLLEHYRDAEVVLAGSPLSTQLLRAHPRIQRTIGLQKSLPALYRSAKEIGAVDLALSFRSSFTSRLFLRMVRAQRRYNYRKRKGIVRHQVLRYHAFVTSLIGLQEQPPPPLSLPYPPRRFDRPTLGINPGATYGSAKRWYPERFARVAEELGQEYRILLFGGPGEVQIAEDIQRHCAVELENLAGKTDIPELASLIGGCDLFITGDSGPMHIAAAYGIPTVALFGPTDARETSPWHHPHARIVRHELSCAPCMRRECPLKTHACMRAIETEEVLQAVKKVQKSLQKGPFKLS